MQETEPRVFCGLPVGGAVSILGSSIIVCQIFGLFAISPFVLYFFEIAIGFGMMFILSTGAKRRKLAYITAYMLYISMYTFWVFFTILGAILATVYLVNDAVVCPPRGDVTTTPKPGSCIENKFTTSDVIIVSISCFFLGISIVVALVQLRFLLILYNFIRHSRRASNTNLNVQYVVPSSPSGMPPPPRYAEHSGHPIPEPSHSSQTAAQAGPLPSKPPLYSEVQKSTGIAVRPLQPEDLSNTDDVAQLAQASSSAATVGLSNEGYDNGSFVTIDISDETTSPSSDSRDRTISLPPAYEEDPNGLGPAASTAPTLTNDPNSHSLI
ncbi:unnamed protein product [Caenorhabditis auriculariae]|uniref:Uncharacterized protein n=1 Tax=Caenorhabditis auriculariae TaxID=2777116 RepID=A0A8S1GU34_9PELO|nr:unnamed protein product [Caenorhabditis auriculariae]